MSGSKPPSSNVTPRNAGKEMDVKPNNWQAVPHNEFSEWARVALEDTRQVYARDTRQPLDAPLVFMPENQARGLRADARAGHLICPVPGCPHPKLTTRHTEDRRDHFVHTIAPEWAHAEFPATVTREILHQWASNLDSRLEVLDDQRVAGVPVSVLVSSPSGRRVALCYTGETLGAEAWEAQHVALENAGIAGVWLFPLRRRYFSLLSARPGPASADSNGLVLDKHLFRAMRRNGSWPLIINIESQEIANLIVPRKAIAGRLRLQAPPYAEGVLHVLISPLARCRLCKDGITTFAVNKHDLEKIRGGYRKRFRTPQSAVRYRRPAPHGRAAHSHHGRTYPRATLTGNPAPQPQRSRPPVREAPISPAPEPVAAQQQVAKAPRVGEDTRTSCAATGQAPWPRMRRLLSWLGLYRVSRRSSSRRS